MKERGEIWMEPLKKSSKIELKIFKPSQSGTRFNGNAVVAGP